MIIKSNNTIPNLITLIFLSAALISCKVVRSGSHIESSVQAPLSQPRIIFLNYSVKFNKSIGEQEIRLIGKTIADGRLKNSMSFSEISKPGDLFCYALNRLMVPVDTILIPDPLNLTVESVDEKNSLFRKEITLDSAQFTLRLQYDEKIHAIGIRTRSKSDTRNEFLLVTKIIQP